MEEKNLATEMLHELKAQSKRWFISFIIVLVLWFATIGVFIWYINQPIEEVETNKQAQINQILNNMIQGTGNNSPINQHIGE